MSDREAVAAAVAATVLCSYNDTCVQFEFDPVAEAVERGTLTHAS